MNYHGKTSSIAYKKLNTQQCERHPCTPSLDHWFDVNNVDGISRQNGNQRPDRHVEMARTRRKALFDYFLVDLIKLPLPKVEEKMLYDFIILILMSF